MEHLDALEAVRRLTLERDALANELDAVKDDFRVSLQTLDSIRAATGLHNYGHHLAESLKAMKEDRDALAQQVAYLTIQAANRERLAEQVKRLEAEAAFPGLPPVWEEMRDGCWKHQTDTFTAFVERIDKKFYATAQTAYQTKNHALGFDYFYQAADRCVLLGQQLTGNAPQAPELIENPNPIALCCNCRFWRDNERPAPNAETGECRRYPPIINGDYPNQMGDYPNTLGIAWCGEWQAK